jgi:hypothetical protein
MDADQTSRRATTSLSGTLSGTRAGATLGAWKFTAIGSALIPAQLAAASGCTSPARSTDCRTSRSC